MDHLVTAVNRIADAQTGTLPLWISIVSPLVLTLISLFLSVRMEHQNKKLQIAFANRDLQNLTRHHVLDIYNAYCTALDCVGGVSDKLTNVFTSEQSYYSWANDVQKTDSELFRAYNQARLMLDDENLLTVLKKARDSYDKINAKISEYIATGIPVQTLTNAWTQISAQYGIVRGDYYSLNHNPIYGEAFSRLCETSHTKRIQILIKEYLDIVGCDDFDERFKKYVKIREMQ